MQCPHCFREVNTTGACPYCGYDAAASAGKYPMALHPGSILNGRYILGHALGQGGFGITYIALDYETKERVAIKEYLPSEFAVRYPGSPSVQVHSANQAENFAYGKAQFLEEAKTLAAFIGNAGIVRIYSYFEENGTAYFCMEYVDGLPLDKYMEKRGGRLSPEEAASLLLPLTESLAAVHAKGIVHRDIAPDNILVTREGQAKLIDFGAARYSTGEKSKSLDVILKHGFAPFEQYSRRGRQGPWTDVYALGATWYYAITGKVPPDSVDRVQEDELVPPSAAGVKIDAASEQALLKALAVTAPERFQSMGEFHAAMLAASDALRREEETRRERALREELKQLEQKRREEERQQRAAQEKAAREEKERLKREEKARRERERTTQREAKKQAQETKKQAQETKRETARAAEAGPKKPKLPLLLGIAALLALVILGTFLFAGQKGTEKDGGAALPEPAAVPAVSEAPAGAVPATAAPVTAPPAAPLPAEGEEVTLTMWSIATESHSGYKPFTDAIAAFESSHPGVKIEHISTENQAYKTKIKSAMASGEDLPDIFFTWGMGFLGDFVRAGRVCCLDSAYERYRDELPEAMTENVRYDGRLYGVPYTMSMVTLYANMDLLASVGYDHIPATWEEMMDCCDKLVTVGIIPFGVSGKEAWCLSEYVEPLIIKSVGGQKLRDMYNGVASWNDPGVVAAIEAFQTMIKKGEFDPKADTLSNDEVKNNFIQGKTAFYQNGSWNNRDIGEQKKFKVKAGVFPALNDAVPLYSLIGGASDTLAVTESCEHKELAIEAAFEIARYVSAVEYKGGANLPCWAADPNVDVTELIQATADMASRAEDMVLYGDTIMSADAAYIYLDYIRMAWTGEVSPAGFAGGLAAELG